MTHNRLQKLLKLPPVKLTEIPTLRVTELPSVTVAPPKRDWVDWGYWGCSICSLVCVGAKFQVYLLWKTLTGSSMASWLLMEKGKPKQIGRVFRLQSRIKLREAARVERPSHYKCRTAFCCLSQWERSSLRFTRTYIDSTPPRRISAVKHIALSKSRTLADRPAHLIEQKFRG